jgi:hypothetical protein
MRNPFKKIPPKNATPIVQRPPLSDPPGCRLVNVVAGAVAVDHVMGCKKATVVLHPNRQSRVESAK